MSFGNKSSTKRTRVELGPVPISDQKWANQIAALNRLNRTITSSNAWKTGWARDSTFAHGGAAINPQQQENAEKGILSTIGSKARGFRTNLRKLRMNRSLSEESKESLRQIFLTFINHANVQGPSSIPKISIDPASAQEFIRTINAFAEQDLISQKSEFTQLQHEITSLISALWIDLPLRGNTALTDRERKKLLSKWLARTVKEWVQIGDFFFI